MGFKVQIPWFMLNLFSYQLQLNTSSDVDHLVIHIMMPSGIIVEYFD